MVNVKIADTGLIYLDITRKKNEGNTSIKTHTDNKRHVHSGTNTLRLWTGPATPLRL